MNAAERVARGARLLDGHAPGWAGLVRLDVMDLSSPCACVLGQVYGGTAGRPGYNVGLRVLGLSEEEAGDSGFLLVGCHEGRAVTWTDRSGLWAAEVRARRVAA